MRRLAALTFICAMLTGCARPSASIEVEGAWAPAMPPTASVAAVYMKITANEPDRLLGASSPIAASVEVHQTSTEDGIARMRPLESISLGQRESVTLEPGGAHLMLLGINTPLEAGKTIELDLQFENAGVVKVQVPVMASDDDHAHH